MAFTTAHDPDVPPGFAVEAWEALKGSCSECGRPAARVITTGIDRETLEPIFEPRCHRHLDLSPTPTN